jgi:hypothetical protein
MLGLSNLNPLYTKGYYALRPAGVVHGPFGTEIGCTLLEIVWYDKDFYLASMKSASSAGQG